MRTYRIQLIKASIDKRELKMMNDHAFRAHYDCEGLRPVISKTPNFILFTQI
jgi:hypothetical protein